MRAVRFNHVITLYGKTSTTNSAGAVSSTLVAVADLRAHIVDASLVEAFAAFGSETTTPTTFRIRWHPGITLDHIIGHQGREFDIVEIRPIGRRYGYDLKCRERRQGAT